MSFDHEQEARTWLDRQVAGGFLDPQPSQDSLAGVAEMVAGAFQRKAWGDQSGKRKASETTPSSPASSAVDGVPSSSTQPNGAPSHVRSASSV